MPTRCFPLHPPLRLPSKDNRFSGPLPRLDAARNHLRVLNLTNNMLGTGEPPHDAARDKPRKGAGSPGVGGVGSGGSGNGTVGGGPGGSVGFPGGGDFRIFAGFPRAPPPPEEMVVDGKIVRVRVGPEWGLPEDSPWPALEELLLG